MSTSDILAIVAIVISVIGFILSRRLDSFLYGPKCRIAAFSIAGGKGLQIQLENVGDRIMYVKQVSYTIDSNIKNKDSYTHNLSSLFYHLPCETRAEARPINEVLFPNSKHNLLTTTFSTQDILMEGWKVIKKLTVKVEYQGPIKRFIPTYRTLSCDYETFLDVMKDENGKIRELKAFVKK